MSRTTQPKTVTGSPIAAVAKILERMREGQDKSPVSASRLLITLDGPCASGKTTLAGELAKALSARVLHTDDFVIPHAEKTKERLAVPGGNCDAERLVREVLAPWKRGAAVCFHRYDCQNRCMREAEELPECSTLILEGSYCNLPAIREYADLRLFMNTPPAIREMRLRERETEESLKRFEELWIPLENAYFEAYRLPDPGCVVVQDRTEEPSGRRLSGNRRKDD